jgi:hypothetical protein
MSPRPDQRVYEAAPSVVLQRRQSSRTPSSDRARWRCAAQTPASGERGNRAPPQRLGAARPATAHPVVATITRSTAAPALVRSTRPGPEQAAALLPARVVHVAPWLSHRMGTDHAPMLPPAKNPSWTWAACPERALKRSQRSQACDCSAYVAAPRGPLSAGKSSVFFGALKLHFAPHTAISGLFE